MKTTKLLMVAGLLLATMLPVSVSAQTDSTETRRSAAVQKREEARARALERVEDREAKQAEIKAAAAARKLALKQDVCERRKERLESRLPRLSQAATTVKSVIDRKYERVTDFYEAKEWNLANYDELVANIETAKADAEASLEVVAGYQIEIDCESENLGEVLDEYRTAVNAAKESLKEYRKQLVELISSMKASAEAEEAEDATNTENETETEAEAETETETEGVENE